MLEIRSNWEISYCVWFNLQDEWSAPDDSAAEFVCRGCSKKYQTEVTEMKKIMLLLSKVTCIMAMALAVLSVNSTCGFTAYQPDVPESLEHD